MISPAPPILPVETRALILSGSGADAASLRDQLAEAGVSALIFDDADDLCRELARGIGILILAGEAVEARALNCLIRELSSQPAWSDVPIVVIGGHDQPVDQGWRLLSDLTPVGSVTLLEDTVSPVTFVSAVLAALRARRRQYELRDHLASEERSRAALRRSEEVIHEAERRKDDFLAMLAHELRNPLGPIRNAVHVLDIMGTQQAEAARVRRMIDRQVAHMARLLDDLLDVSLITRGRIRLHREPLDLAPLIRTSVEDLRTEIESRGLSVTVHLPREPLPVIGDPTRLSQVFANLLQNAVKFTRPGGQVAISARRDDSDGTIRATIQDTGIGIDADMLRHVFDSFAQADRSLDRSSGGLGLGLALVKGLVELHGGSVEAASAGLARGSEFTIRLPADASAQAMHRPATEEGDRSVFRILIVEDNEDAAESLGVLLQLVGHTVQVAHDGAEGLEKARDFKPDVVLCDIGLPGDLDGYALARSLRADPETRGGYLIALTGYGQEEDLAKARVSGFDLHLTKPVDPGALRRLLAEPLPPHGPNGAGVDESGRDTVPI